MRCVPRVGVLSVPLVFRVAADMTPDEERLFAAAWEGDVEAVRGILNAGVDVNAEDMWGNTALYWAARNGRVAVVQLLVAEGAEVNAEDNHGYTPLIWAVKGRHLDIVQLLLEKGAEVNAEDNRGYTPLIWAVRERHLDIVQLLLEKGAEVNATNDYGQTALHMAEEGEVAHFLLEHGADVAVADNEGRTPIDYAAGAHWAGVPDTDLICKMLLPTGALVALALNGCDAHEKRLKRIGRALVPASESAGFLADLAGALAGIDASGGARGPGARLRALVRRLEQDDAGPLQPALARALQSADFRSDLADALACELDNVSGPASPLAALARQLCAAGKDGGDGAREQEAAGARKRRRGGAA